MGLFKKKAVREISGGAWGHLVTQHGLDVDTLARSMRCVEKEGLLQGEKPVTFLRVFHLGDLEKKGVDVKDWETLDEHPDLIRFEGYITKTNEAFLQRAQ